ncbi:MAG: hypothetical protein ACTSVV_16270 [Promethearchaeota archaeon]
MKFDKKDIFNNILAIFKRAALQLIKVPEIISPDNFSTYKM